MDNNTEQKQKSKVEIDVDNSGIVSSKPITEQDNTASSPSDRTKKKGSSTGRDLLIIFAFLFLIWFIIHLIGVSMERKNRKMYQELMQNDTFKEYMENR